MWSAIRNDLFEFVHVVTNDTKVTLTKVLGEEAIDETKVRESYGIIIL